MQYTDEKNHRKMRTMEKQFAIFDMDGTLIDSMPYWGRLTGEYLGQLQISENRRASLLRKTRRLGMQDAAAVIQSELHLDQTPMQIVLEMGNIIDAHYLKDIPLKPHVKTYLRRLQEMGVAMCVATLTPVPLARYCLERLGIADYFAFMRCCDEVGAGKERPDIFLQCAWDFGARPYEIAVYEDSYYAAMIARRAGFYTIGVYDDSSARHWDDMVYQCDETILDWAEAANDL